MLIKIEYLTEAIDPELDLTQLNRNENLDETAVLKQPLDLNAIQQQPNAEAPVIEEDVVKEEDVDFPDEKEKRGMKIFPFGMTLTLT